MIEFHENLQKVYRIIKTVYYGLMEKEDLL